MQFINKLLINLLFLFLSFLFCFSFPVFSENLQTMEVTAEVLPKNFGRVFLNYHFSQRVPPLIFEEDRIVCLSILEKEDYLPLEDGYDIFIDITSEKSTLDPDIFSSIPPNYKPYIPFKINVEKKVVEEITPKFNTKAPLKITLVLPNPKEDYRLMGKFQGEWVELEDFDDVSESITFSSAEFPNFILLKKTSFDPKTGISNLPLIPLTFFVIVIFLGLLTLKKSGIKKR
ncbi:MAG: hypothetical protein ACRCU3_08525 [Eubacteriaceae bacterium]